MEVNSCGLELIFFFQSPASTHRNLSDWRFIQPPAVSVKSITAQCVTAVAMAGQSKLLHPHSIAPLLQAAELNLTSGCHRLHCPPLSVQLCISTFTTLSSYLYHLMAFILKCDLLYIII